jgi:hypothetical protein
MSVLEELDESAVLKKDVEVETVIEVVREEKMKGNEKRKRKGNLLNGRSGSACGGQSRGKVCQERGE